MKPFPPWGVSKERIRQIQEVALARLRRMLASKEAGS